MIFEDKNKLHVSFYLREKSYNPHKQVYTLYMRLRYKREQAEMSLQHQLKKSEWDELRELSTNDLINEEISGLRSRVYNIKRELQENKLAVTAKRIKKVLQKEEYATGLPNVKLKTAFEAYIAYLRKSGRHRESTIEDNRTKFRRIEGFLKEEGEGEIQLNAFTHFHLERLDEYLVTSVSTQYKRPLKRSYINSIHRSFKAFFNRNYKLGHIKENPYNRFDVPRDDDEKTIKYLDKEQLKRVHELDLRGNKRLQTIKDIFLFSCYTGLRYSDVCNLRIEEIQRKDGGWVIKKVTQKRKKHVYIPLLKPAEHIFLQYKDGDTAKVLGKLFGISNQHLNGYLKEIAALCNIDMNLTHHVARHTFGTWLLSNGMRLEVVKELMGHASIKTTEIYAKILKESLHEEMLGLNKRFFEGGEG